MRKPSAKKPKKGKSLPFELKKGDHILTAWAEVSAGPGWGNCLVWVLINSADGVLRKECIKPDEQSRDISLLFNIAAKAHVSLLKAVRAMDPRDPPIM